MSRLRRVLSAWLLLVVVSAPPVAGARTRSTSRAHRSAASAVEAPPPRTAMARPPGELAWQRGLKQGWSDIGWSDRRPAGDGGVLHDLKSNGGWILVRDQALAASAAGGLSFTFKAPPEAGDFLELRLDKDSSSASDWKRVRIGAAHQRALPDGSVQVFVPMSELNPKRLAFDRIVFFAYKELASTWVRFDDVALTAPAEGSVKQR